MVERALLGLALPFAGLLTGLLSSGVALTAGAPEFPVMALACVGMIGGVVAASCVVPRIVPSARAFSLSRRVLAGVAGIVGLAVGGHLAVWLGLDPDALSHSPSYWAILEEAVAMAVGYGAMVAAASTMLGRPKTESEPVAG
jgi:hypothetical protein